MRLRPALAATLLTLVGIGALWSAAETLHFTPERYIAHVRYLASDELKGRGTGTPELEKAARYIARQFKQFGLRPAGGRGYMQAFPMSVNIHPGPGNSVEYATNGTRIDLKAAEEFNPSNLSSSGEASAQVAFAGYGITAPEYHYDDYAGLDVKGKWALVLRHEPQEFDEKSVFAGRNYTEHAQFSTKAANAKLHGAKGVILVGDLPNHSGDSDVLEKFGHSMGPAEAGVLCFEILWRTAEQWSAGAGQDLRSAVRAIDQDLKPRSFTLPAALKVRATIDVQREVRSVHNIVGFLPGESAEYLILGAHYDHIGHGELFSMAPSGSGSIHPGADDNASGTAGVLELARYYGAAPKQKRGILFLAFSGEELGLLGSSYYVRNPKLPLRDAVAMLNLDMIGRMREDRVFVGGVSTGTGLQPMIERLAARSGLHVNSTEVSGYGASDHASFQARQIPAVFFFSGYHDDYHRPGDTWDKIDAGAAVRLLELVLAVSGELLAAPERPSFVLTVPPVAEKVAAGAAK